MLRVGVTSDIRRPWNWNAGSDTLDDGVSEKGLRSIRIREVNVRTAQ